MDRNFDSASVSELKDEVIFTYKDFSEATVGKLKNIPESATMSLNGQKLIRKIIEPVKYDSNKIVKLEPETLKEFGISQSDYKNIHKFDHITQNKGLASKTKE